VWLEYCRLDDAGKIAALGDAGWREKLAEYWHKAGYLKNAVVEKVENPKLKPIEGRRLADIAQERGIDIVEAMFDIARDDNLKTFFLLSSPKISPEDEAALKQILKSPATLLGVSDGGAHLQTFSGADYPTYFLKRWVRETGLFTLEDGIAALTSEPAPSWVSPTAGPSRSASTRTSPSSIRRRWRPRSSKRSSSPTAAACAWPSARRASTG